MEFFQKQVKKGVICNYCRMDHIKTSFVSVDFLMPISEEIATSMSLLSGVLSRGCKELPSMDQISRYLSNYYGISFSINSDKAGEYVFLTFSAEYLNNEYAIDGKDIRAAVFCLIRNMIFDPLTENGHFKEDYVNQEISNLEDRIDGLLNDKRAYALSRCKEEMCSGEPYGINPLGSKASLKKTDALRLFDFYLKMIRDATVVITYVGENREKFPEDFAGLFTPRVNDLPATIIKPASSAAREIIESMELSQAKLNLGFRLGSAAQKKHAACRLFNVLYGASPTSRLFTNVREKRSLCYYCMSAVDRLKNVMFVICGIETENYDEARREILDQLSVVARGDFSEEEFMNAKAYLTDSIRGNCDSKSAIAAMMLAGTLLGAPESPEREIAEIESVSREDVMEIASETVLDTVFLLKGVSGADE